MGTYNFVTDGGAPIDGTSSCSVAVDSWRTYATNAANQPATLHFPNVGAAHYNIDSNNALFRAVGQSPTVTADADVTISSLTIGTPDIFPTGPPNPIGSYFQTALAGSSTITLMMASDISRYSTGQFVCIGGLEVQAGATFPPNLHRFQWNQITGISGAAITLAKPLREAYSSTWPRVPDEQGGPGIIYGLGGYVSPYTAAQAAEFWDQTITINDLGVTGLVSHQAVRYIVMTGMTLGDTHSPNMSESIVLTNCSLATTEMEVDKLIEYLEFNNCNSTGSIVTQSGCINNLMIKGCTLLNLVGTPRTTQISDSAIGTLFIGPLGFGRGDDLTITNSTITDVQVPVGSNWPPPNAFTNLGNGLMRIAKADVPAYSGYAWYDRSSPGYAFAFGYTPGGVVTVTPDSGPVIYFCLTDIYEDSIYLYAQTTLPDIWPTPTYYGGNPSNMIWPYPITTYSGSVLMPDTAVAPTACSYIPHEPSPEPEPPEPEPPEPPIEPPPVVTEVQPNEGPRDGGTSVRIIGSNFVNVSAVRFGETAAPFAVSDPTLITATSPAGNGNVHIQITTSVGMSVLTNADRFKYGK